MSGDVLIIAGAVGLLGVLVGLCRPVAAIWPLLAILVVFIPIGNLVAGGSALNALAAGGICVIIAQGGYVIGLVIRWLFRKRRHQQAAKNRRPHAAIEEKAKSEKAEDLEAQTN
jgi:hypothetical protein